MRHLKHLFILSFSFFTCIALHAQSVSQVKESNEFIWAEGSGSTPQNADRAALEALMSEISLSISSSTEMKIANRQGGTTESQVETEKIFKTYSTATLNNTHRMDVGSSKDRKAGSMYTVMRYIKKTEIDKIFESRKNKAIDFVKLAHQEVKRTQLSEALRYYYWSWALVQSLRYPNEAEVPDEKGVMQKADSYIPRCINNIFTGLNLTVDEIEDNICYLNFTYNEKPVASIDYYFYDGMDWSIISNAIDGQGIAELRPSYEPKELKVLFEYQYLQEAQVDKEVQQVLDAINGQTFPKGETKVALNWKKNNKKAKEQNKETTIEAVVGIAAATLASIDSLTIDAELKGTENQADTIIKEGLAVVLETAHYEQTMEQVITAIRTRNYESVQEQFTEEGWDVYQRLIHYGNAQIIGIPTITVDTLYSYTYCRAVPMQFTFSRDRRFSENVVFVFNETGKIDNVQFGLSQTAEGDILANPTWSVQAKLVLRNFLENYKTAYALKRLDYLEQVFAEDALIITGKVVYKTEGDPENGFRKNKYVQTTKQSKRTYLNNLRRVFAGQEFINLRFAKNEVMRLGKGGEIYGIQIKQDYFSASYGDSGYLFIVVDVNNPNMPIIHVRAWQEEPDPNWGLIGPEMF